MTGPVLLAQNELRQYLQIEPEKQINMVISLGFPKDKPKKPRKEVDEITTFFSQNKKTLNEQCLFILGRYVINLLG